MKTPLLPLLLCCLSTGSGLCQEPPPGGTPQGDPAPPPSPAAAAELLSASFATLRQAWRAAPAEVRAERAPAYIQAAILTADRLVKTGNPGRAADPLREAGYAAKSCSLVLGIEGGGLADFLDVAPAHVAVLAATGRDPLKGAPLAYELGRLPGGFYALLQLHGGSGLPHPSLAGVSSQALAWGESGGVILFITDTGAVVNTLGAAIDKKSPSLRAGLRGFFVQKGGFGGLEWRELEFLFAEPAGAVPPSTPPAPRDDQAALRRWVLSKIVEDERLLRDSFRRIGGRDPALLLSTKNYIPFFLEMPSGLPEAEVSAGEGALFRGVVDAYAGEHLAGGYLFRISFVEAPPLYAVSAGYWEREAWHSPVFGRDFDIAPCQTWESLIPGCLYTTLISDHEDKNLITYNAHAAIIRRETFTQNAHGGITPPDNILDWSAPESAQRLRSAVSAVASRVNPTLEMIPLAEYLSRPNAPWRPLNISDKFNLRDQYRRPEERERLSKIKPLTRDAAISALAKGAGFTNQIVRDPVADFLTLPIEDRYTDVSSVRQVDKVLIDLDLDGRPEILVGHHLMWQGDNNGVWFAVYREIVPTVYERMTRPDQHIRILFREGRPEYSFVGRVDELNATGLLIFNPFGDNINVPLRKIETRQFLSIDGGTLKIQDLPGMDLTNPADKSFFEKYTGRAGEQGGYSSASLTPEDLQQRGYTIPDWTKMPASVLRTPAAGGQ